MNQSRIDNIKLELSSKDLMDIVDLLQDKAVSSKSYVEVRKCVHIIDAISSQFNNQKENKNADN